MGLKPTRFITKEINHFAKSGVPDYEKISKYYPDSQTSSFINDYLKICRDGHIKSLAEKYHMSICTVVRLRNKLHLPLLFETDARKHLIKRIKRLYYEGRSSLQIAEIVNYSPEQIRHILIDERVTLRPAHVTDCRYFKTQQTKFTKTLLLKEIKKLYVDEHMPCKQIADRLGIWEGTVSSKLKAMGIQIEFKRRQANIQVWQNKDIIGIYNGDEPYMVVFGKPVAFTMPVNKTGIKGNCVWCGSEFVKYISKGPKTQIFCNHKCKNKAKDLRRILKPKWVKKKYVTDFSARLKVLALEIKGDIEQLGLTDDVKEKVYALRAEVGLSPLPSPTT